MIQFTVPPGKVGIAMGEYVGNVYSDLRPLLEKHYDGTDRLWPEDPQLCEEMCKKMWEEIYSLRNQASFLLGSIDDVDVKKENRVLDPIYQVSKNAVLLELMDNDVGAKAGGYVEMIWDFILDNPLLPKSPHRRARVYH